MSASVSTAMNILGYNSWLFGNAVTGVAEDRAAFRVNDRTNQFDRLAGHVTVTRHSLAGLMQIDVPELPWGAFADPSKGTQFEEVSECPPLEDITAKFNNVTEALMRRLPEVSDQLLAAPSPIPIPGENPTMGDLLDFLTMHETYHIGQMGLLKKSMGGTGIMEG